jgi:hypothetical protein
MRYHEGNIIEEYRDHKSELYGPQMRYGEHPKHHHEVINVQSRFLTHIKGENMLYILEITVGNFMYSYTVHRS